MDLFTAPSRAESRAYFTKLEPLAIQGLPIFFRAVDQAIKNNQSCIELSVLYGALLSNNFSRYRAVGNGVVSHVDQQICVMTGLFMVELLQSKYLACLPGQEFQFDIEPYLNMLMHNSATADDDDPDREAINDYVFIAHQFFCKHFQAFTMSLARYDLLVYGPLWDIFEALKLSADIEKLSFEPGSNNNVVHFKKIRIKPQFICPN